MAFTPFSTFRAPLPQSPLMNLRQNAPTPKPTVIGNIGQQQPWQGNPLSPSIPQAMSPFASPTAPGAASPSTSGVRMSAPDPFGQPQMPPMPKAMQPYNRLGQRPGIPMVPRTPARGPGGY